MVKLAATISAQLGSTDNGNYRPIDNLPTTRYTWPNHKSLVDELSQMELLHAVFCRRVRIPEDIGLPVYEGVVAHFPWSFIQQLDSPIALTYAFAIRNLSEGLHNLYLVVTSPSGQKLLEKPSQFEAERTRHVHYGHAEFELTAIEPGDFTFRLLIDENPIATSVLPVVSTE